MIDAETVIVEELERLAPLGDYEGSDWDEVLRRATLTQAAGRRRRVGRRRRIGLVLIGVAAVAGALIVVSAFGAGPGFLDFWQASQAPKRVVHSFARLNRVPLPQWDPRVIAGETRLVTTYHLRDGMPYPLYVAPRQGGGFCDDFKDGGGCIAPGERVARNIPGDLDAGAFSLGSQGDASLHILEGEVFDRHIVSLAVRYKAGIETQVPVLWVGGPINAGFFFYEVPQGSWNSIVAVVAKDADGHQVARNASFFAALRTLPPAWFTPSKVADFSKEHVILRAGPLSLSIAPSRTGGNCVWLRARSRIERQSCTPPALLKRQINAQLTQGAVTNKGPDYAVYFGAVKADVARLELRFQDGMVVTLNPVNGYVLYNIPQSHWTLGHRLDAVVAHSSTGRILQRDAIDPHVRYFYGCALPTQCRD